MEYKKPRNEGHITPRLIIHGGAGNILPSNLPPAKYKAYHDSLLSILSNTHHFLTSPSSTPLCTSSSASAIDTVTFAVTQLEDNPLFNSGHGAVFTRDGINELEASIMVSKGKKKRGVGIMGIQHVKNPIKLTREMLLRGETDLDGGNGEHRGAMSDSTFKSSGAQGHCQLHKYSAEELAREWGMEMCDPSYYFVQSRWDEHIRGLEKEKSNAGPATWSHEEFFPQGTCGAVALDSKGILACATSTGGMTNKLTGRIGDTPTLGAGFWAEEWEDESPSKQEIFLRQPGPALVLSETLKGLMADCFPTPGMYTPIPEAESSSKKHRVYRSSALSGTGNGDSFLRTNAVRTTSAIARYRGSKTSLQDAVTEVSGPGGDLQKSAGDRWKRTGEGEGGMVGIEFTLLTDSDDQYVNSVSRLVNDFNCGGMFRAAVDENGKGVMRVWKPGRHAGLEAYEGEGRAYDLEEWLNTRM